MPTIQWAFSVVRDCTLTIRKIAKDSDSGDPSKAGLMFTPEFRVMEVIVMAAKTCAACDCEFRTKADVVAFVKKSVNDGGDFITGKGEAGLKESVSDSLSRLIRLEDLAHALIEHSAEHYGQLVVYYRINGMVPPESRPK